MTSCVEHDCRLLEFSEMRTARILGREMHRESLEAPRAVLDRYTHQALTTGRVALPGRSVHAGVWFRLLRSLPLDDAVNAVQSEQALVKIAADIEEQLHGVKAQMASVNRRRAVAVSGAVVGTAGAVLAAVYGPAMEEAVKLIAAGSAGSGLWTIIDTATTNSPRALKEDRWHYVWALSRRAQTLS